MSTAYERILARSKKENIIFVKKSFDIADKIHHTLKSIGMTQKDLAKKLSKNESEISKWLSGQHNFTIKSIAKIEAVLNVELIHVDFEVDRLLFVKRKVRPMTILRKIKQVDESIKYHDVPGKFAYHQRPSVSDKYTLKVA